MISQRLTVLTKRLLEFRSKLAPELASPQDPFSACLQTFASLFRQYSLSLKKCKSGGQSKFKQRQIKHKLKGLLQSMQQIIKENRRQKRFKMQVISEQQNLLQQSQKAFRSVQEHEPRRAQRVQTLDQVRRERAISYEQESQQSKGLREDLLVADQELQNQLIKVVQQIDRVKDKAYKMSEGIDRLRQGDKALTQKVDTNRNLTQKNMLLLKEYLASKPKSIRCMYCLISVLLLVVLGLTFTLLIKKGLI